MKTVDYEIPDNTNVLVGTPNFTNLITAEAHSNHITACVEWTKWGLPFNWTLVGRTFVHFARTQICQAALAGGFTHIFWVDDDALFDPEILPRFISHDKDVVIAPYPMRRPPYQLGILSSQTGNYHDQASYRNLPTSMLNRGLVEVDGGGTHCMLVKTECLQRAGEPSADSIPPEIQEVLSKMDEAEKVRFSAYISEAVDDSLSFEDEDGRGRPFFVMPKTGTEDMMWCYRAKKKGIEIWADTDVFANHVGFYPTIDRAFTERCEQVEAAGGIGAMSEAEKVQITTPASAARDHTAIHKSRSTNLV